ncbi:DNA-directed RNA polymerase, subunit K/omega [Methanomethylovorans hollandica DSM 15978]|uniref:DNA-directed RNA polymerase subunit Rpo6 n=1 Tax=Methanomethylovorans hollandica (strain DSM 15978 / NBRC 107637 / DMS1) TaxID=867904 RepID=L0KWM6_METHD|nr:DNA-directed RNA polymerase subunit K [Methanomethylovorans hollandica]AGB49832.1 DNA-directed RNA polymerase, subunit K/omega [Methanomethylovorans hollandica DSM 15978]
MSTEHYTRYERARIIGARSLQISMGAPVLIDDPGTQSLYIAKKELELGVIPITVKRDHKKVL